MSILSRVVKNECSLFLFVAVGGICMMVRGSKKGSKGDGVTESV
jgi:hypothetical protein